MVIHTQVDWRTLPQALEWDVALVRGVFYRIHMRYDAASHAKLTRVAPLQSPPSQQQAPSNQSTHTNEELPPQEPLLLDEHRLVAKADVLIGLKTTEHYLDKRPFLRSLYTILACCSNEKEMHNVASYVKFRVRERTISFAMVRATLQEIYKKHMDLIAFQARVDEFKAAARAKSTWCVRDPRAITRSPSRFYGVHNIPPKPKTQKQIDTELQLIKAHAVAVAANAISLVMAQLVGAARPKSRQRSAQSGRRSSVSRGATPSEEVPKNVRRAKQKRDKQQADARCKELRLQILAPGIAQTRQTTTALSSHSKDGAQDHRSGHTTKQLEILALIEANGDPSIAQQLLHQTIPRSGFTRVTEHLANLSGTSISTGEVTSADESTDDWSIFKLWKTVYRSRTIQAIQRLEQ